MSNTTTLSALALSAALSAAALGGAASAAADPLSGSYTATVTDSFGTYLGPPVTTWVFTPCGPDCVTVDAQGAQLRQVNGAWRGTYELRASDNGEIVTCTRGIGPDLTSAADVCPQPLGLMVNFQLTKIA